MSVCLEVDLLHTTGRTPASFLLHWRSLAPVCGQHHTPSRPATALAYTFQCFCQRVRQSPSSSRAGPEPSDESPADMVKMTKSKTFQAYLPHCHRTYSCIHCRAHLANHDELISKSFQGSQGRAYLFNSVVNVGCGPAEERVLLTGLHAVADIYCENCKTTLGWKYGRAHLVHHDTLQAQRSMQSWALPELCAQTLACLSPASLHT
ncbi:protein yippee-like 1 isoform X3 [Mus musculus]|uniref:protein yippee-like 1 isoform X3 n=1 Tax=Mus musculus TaxID=10090 RepID=UPI0003D6E987|nr:protein yippee-like 1 isoform X3 [Mus musculus]|eukprot:XP_006521740.1 PREDICTED: protein yippee-like 1 isoform X3 [Mus musculus]